MYLIKHLANLKDISTAYPKGT